MAPIAERVAERALRDIGLSKSEAIYVISEVKAYVNRYGESNPGKSHLGICNTLSYFLAPDMSRKRNR